MQKSRTTDFKSFIAEFPRLKYDFKSFMNYHYGFDIFNSQKDKTLIWNRI